MLVVQQVGCEQQNQNFQRETPHLELNAGHMVANSLENVWKALKKYPITLIYEWLGSTVALYWIQGDQKEWNQFVFNRVAKIKQKNGITW